MDKVRGEANEKDAAVTARLDALKKNKEALDDTLEKRRQSVRFEPTAIEGGDDDVTVGMDAPGSGKKSSGAQTASEKPKESGASYTERLLAAKRKARKD